MTKCFGFTSGVCHLTALAITAQPVPRVKTHISCSYIRVQPDGSAPTFQANGGSVHHVYNFNRWLALVGDFGGYRADHVLVSAPVAKPNGVEFKPSLGEGSLLERRLSAVATSDQIAQYRRVEVWYVPGGAELPKSQANSWTLAAMKISDCPK
jgi:hypothetical protein